MYRNDGSFWTGVAMVGIALVCFCGGYAVRDAGYGFEVIVPERAR